MQSSNVENLFEHHAVADIREIRKKLRAEIDKRKQDVKELVK